MERRFDMSCRMQRSAALLVGAGLVLWSGAAEAQAPAPYPPPYAPPPYAPPPYAPPPYAPPPYPYAPPSYAPPSYYPPPQYAPAPYAPAPPAPTPAVEARSVPPPVVEDWDPDAPVPAGYRQVDEANGRLIGVGIGLLATGWAASLLVGSIAANVEENDDPGEDDGVEPGDWVPMYIPVVGPFVTLGTVDVRPSGVGFLIASGIVQAGGVLGIVLGLVDRRHKIVRQEVGRAVTITPTSGPGFQGLQAVGRF